MTNTHRNLLSIGGVLVAVGVVAAQIPSNGQVVPPPGQVQVAPGQVQVTPGQVQVVPGQVQVTPGQVQQVTPGQVQFVPGQVQTPTQIMPANGQVASGQVIGEDPLIAACMLIHSRKQWDISTFAESRLQDEGAKQFARNEAEHARKITDKLKALGYEYPQETPSSAVQQVGATNSPPMRLQSLGNVVLLPGSSNAIEIEKQVANKCVENMKKHASEKEAREFDKMFVTMQLVGHHAAKERAEVLKNHASDQLKPIIDECIQESDREIKALKETAKTLWKSEKTEQ